VAAWLSGTALVSINEVTLRRARFVLEWVIVCGLTNLLGLTSSVYLRQAQPSTLSWTEMSTGQSTVTLCGLGVKAGVGHSNLWMDVWVAGKTV